MAEQEQRLSREEEFKKNLSGELLANALDFAKHMEETSGWEHLGEGVCFTVTDPDHLYIYFGTESSVCTSEFDKYPISDEMKEFAWANVNQCNHFRTSGGMCGCGKQPGLSFIILGRKFDNLCARFALGIPTLKPLKKSRNWRKRGNFALVR